MNGVQEMIYRKKTSLISNTVFWFSFSVGFRLLGRSRLWTNNPILLPIVFFVYNRARFISSIHYHACENHQVTVLLHSALVVRVFWSFWNCLALVCNYKITFNEPLVTAHGGSNKLQWRAWKIKEEFIIYFCFSSQSVYRIQDEILK